MHYKRLNAPHRSQLGLFKISLEESKEFLEQALKMIEQALAEENAELAEKAESALSAVHLGEQVLEELGLRGVLKDHQKYVPSDEKPCETKTQIVFIQGCPPGLRSLYLEAPRYQLGLEFTRSAMQPQRNLEDPLCSFKTQKKLEQLFTSLEDPLDQAIARNLQAPLSSFKKGRRGFELLGISRDTKRKEPCFMALCLERARNRDFVLSEWEKEERRDFRALRTEKALPVVQQRKQQKDQFKQSCKQEQKWLKQQLSVTFQKNKKLPKSQQQVKQIAHRKRW